MLSVQPARAAAPLEMRSDCIQCKPSSEVQEAAGVAAEARAASTPAAVGVVPALEAEAVEAAVPGWLPEVAGTAALVSAQG